MPSDDKRFRAWLYAAGFLLLSLNFLEFPHHPYDVTHDLSSHASFEYYAAKGFQFGKDVYQNVGPYGYVHYTYSYIGYLHEQKVLLKSICRLALAILVLATARRFPDGWSRLIWLGSFFVFIPVGDSTSGDYLDLGEIYPYLTLYLSALLLLEPRADRGALAKSVALMVLLGFLALTKHTCLLFASWIVAVTCVDRFLRREIRLAVVSGAAFVSSVTLLWMQARQELTNLPSFLLGVLAFSGGYNEAMGSDVEGPPYLIWIAVAILTTVAARILYNWLRFQQGFARAAIEGFFLLAIWKHGFVRADIIHMCIFFYTVPFLAQTLFVMSRLPPPNGTSADAVRFTAGIGSRACAATLIVVAIVAMLVGIPEGRYRPIRLINHLRHNASWLVSPRERTAQMEAGLAEVKKRHELPELRRTVGQSSIDFFGTQPGFLLLNGLNYRPRPMPITFAAFNDLLLRRNEAFYRDSTAAPDFILSHLDTVDGRLIPQDDGLALAAMLDNYHPVGFENELLLLRRNGPSFRRFTPARRLLADRKVKLGQKVSLLPFGDDLIWVEIDVEPSRVNRLRSLLYKPAPCHLRVRLDGEPKPRTFKFISAMGSSGFLLSPFVENDRDLFNLYLWSPPPEDRRKVDAFAVASDPSDTRYFKSEIHIKLFGVGAPPVQVEAP